MLSSTLVLVAVVTIALSVVTLNLFIIFGGKLMKYPLICKNCSGNIGPYIIEKEKIEFTGKSFGRSSLWLCSCKKPDSLEVN